MLLEAARDFNLDLTQCFIVGDKNTDILAGNRVGCFTILVSTGNTEEKNGGGEISDVVIHNLNQAASLIRMFIKTDKPKIPFHNKVEKEES